METSAPTVRALDLEVVKLRTANVELVTALGWFMGDPRFVVSVGGNPRVVERMLDCVRNLIAKHGA